MKKKCRFFGSHQPKGLTLRRARKGKMILGRAVDQVMGRRETPSKADEGGKKGVCRGGGGGGGRREERE